MALSEAREASARICERLFCADWYADCVWIYGYYPIGMEVDCRHFLKQALDNGKRVALPRMETEHSFAEECHMDFYEITSLDQVTRGSFGVPEPIQVCSMVQKEEAIVLVPGVVFDRMGNRYGYGKGYYDRYFARFPQMYKLGLSYEKQLEPELFVSETDVKMDGIYTESQYYQSVKKE